MTDVPRGQNPPLDRQEQRVREYLRWSDHDMAVRLRRMADPPGPPRQNRVRDAAFLVAVAERLDRVDLETRLCARSAIAARAEHVLRAIEQYPARVPITRDDLARLTGMDQDEVAKIADQLAREGRIERGRTREGAANRSERLVAYFRKDARDDS
jgi:hypothetical protein